MNRNMKLTRPKKEYRKGFKTTEMSALIESELQRLQIRICDVEGTLRFSQYDLKSWKENIVKCLKLFHLLIFIIEEQKNFRISCLLKRILGCVSVIFSRSSPSGVQIFRKQAKHLESPVSRCSVAASPNKPRHSMCNLGGVTTSDCLQRGLEIKSSDAMVLHQDSEDEIIHEEYPIQLKQLDIIRSMERDQYKVAQINNIEQQIDKYLLYLAQCEKSASKLLDTEIVSCGFELENAFSCINVQLENRKNGHFETSNKIKEIVRAYRRLFQQKHKVMTIQKSDQSVQANTFMPSEVRKTFSETPQPSPPSEIKSLNFSLAHYKEEILRLNKEASDQKADNDRYVQIINALYTQIMYTETINLRLQEKFNKLASIDFLQEIDFVIGNESPPEIRVKLANSLQTLIKKLGIDKSQTQSKKRVQLTLPHDIIKYGGVDRLLNHISNEIGSNKSIDGEKDIKSPRRKSQMQQTFFQDSPRKIIDETPEEKNATKKLTRKDINKPLKTLKNVINKTQVKNLYKSKKQVKISEENPHKLTEKADSSYFKSQKKLKKTIQSKKLLDKKQQKYQNEINIDQINKDLLKKQLLNIKFFEQEKLKNSTPILFQNSKQSHRISDTKMQSPTNFNTRHLKSFQKLQQNHFSTRHLKPVQGIQDNPRKQLIPLVNIRQTQPISAVNLQENEELTSNSNIQNQQEDSVIYPSIKFALDRLESSKFVQTSNTNIEKNQIGDKTGKERQMILTRTFDFFVHPTKKSEHKSSFETSQFDKFDLNINKSDRQINEDQFQYAPERFVQTLSRFRKIEKNLPRLTLDFSTKSRGSSVGNYFNQTGLVKGQTFSIQSKANQSLEPRTSLIVKPQSQKNQDVMIMQIISTHKKQEIITKIKELYPNNWLNFFCKDLAIRQMLGSLRRKSNLFAGYRGNFSKLFKQIEKIHNSMCGPKRCEHIENFYTILQEKIKWIKLYPNKSRNSPINRTCALSEFDN